MHQDLDRLMKERGLAGMVVLALDRYSPAMYYVTGQRIHYGVYFRTPDGNAYLVHDPMERDQAEAAGCPHAAFEQHGMSRLQDEEVVPARVLGRLIGEIGATLGMRGTLAWFGDVPVGFAHALLEVAREIQPALRVDDTRVSFAELAAAHQVPPDKSGGDSDNKHSKSQRQAAKRIPGARPVRVGRGGRRNRGRGYGFNRFNGRRGLACFDRPGFFYRRGAATQKG